jgi:hypothetical protein
MGLLDMARRLDNRVLPPSRSGYEPGHHLKLFGMLALVIFGGGGLLRLVFRDQMRTTRTELWVYFAVAGLGLVLLVIGTARRRR